MNNIEWLSRESAGWVEDGIITPEQQQQIQLRYPAGKASSPLLLFFAIIGSLLIGGGVILIFATNWWKLPVALKLVISLLPLLAAQGLCLYVYLKRPASPSFREGGTIFLTLAFFAAVALIGQVFHTPSDLQSYILVCILFALPGIYLFRAKAAMAVYIAGVLFTGWSWPQWTPLILALLPLPFFYWEIRASSKGSSSKGLQNYLLFLLSLLIVRTVIQITDSTMNLEALEIALVCSLMLLLLDVLFRKISSEYFFTAAKLLAFLIITAASLIAAFDFSYESAGGGRAFILAAIITAAYAALRYKRFTGPSSADLLFGAAVVLILFAQNAGAAANVIMAALGVLFIVRGSKTLKLSQLNYGMALIVSLIAIRFFDSAISLLARGIVFILLGTAFLGINLYISRKKRGPAK
ncbi:MAG: DUF2157 domain-containing protein [Clostridiales bacterium]